MKSLEKNKVVLIAIFLFAVVIFAYNTFFKQGGIASPDGQSATSIGDDLLKLHGELKKVTLKKELFSHPGYNLLEDFNTPIPNQSIGRPNPFEIIGRD